MKKVKIESAFPQIRMLERPRSHSFEVWCWKIKYLLVPKNKKGCLNCKIEEGTVILPLRELSYSKARLAEEVKKHLGK